MLGEMFGSVIEHAPHGRVGPAQDALNAVDGAEPVRAVDEVAAAGADEDVLAMVGDADHFMRHQLAYGNDGVPFLSEEKSIHFHANREVKLAFGEFVNQ